MILTSRDNPRLKLLRRLRSSAGTRVRSSATHGTSSSDTSDGSETPLLLLEGRHLLETALDASIEVETVLVDADRDQAFAELLSRARNAGAEVFRVASGLLREAADTDAPQGIVGLGRAPLPAPSVPPQAGPAFLLDGLQDPGNVGALVRSAAAAGCAAGFASPGTCAWWHPRALRASAGAAFRLPLHWSFDAEAAAEHCPRPWIALEAHGGTELWRADLPISGTLCVGSEAHGLSPSISAAADLRLTIPISERVESLNATVAASVVLFEWARRRRAQD